MKTEKIELTAKRLDALPPAPAGQRYEIADTHVNGLRVRVGDEAIRESRKRAHIGKAAQISFVLLARYSPKGNPTRRTLGTYHIPLPIFTLDDARKLAIEWKSLIKQGIDPAEKAEAERASIEQLRKEAEEAVRNRRSVKDLLDRYDEEYLKVELRTAAATRRALDGSHGLLANLADRDPKSITRDEIAGLVKDRAKGSPISANRQLAYANAFFNWCVEEGLLPSNPAITVKKPGKEIERDREHSIEELGEIWSAAGRLGYPFAPLYRLLVALPNRREEIAAMQVSELFLGSDDAPELAVWTLPGERTKNGKALRIPLSPLARSIIKEALADEVRPQHGPDQSGQMRPNPFVFSTTGNSPVSGFTKGKRRLDAAIALARAKEAEQGQFEPRAMDHWTVHDLRTTFATLASQELKVAANVADRCLNHVATATTSKIARIYNKNDLFDERRAALCAWAELIKNRVIGEPDGKIVSIGQAKRA